MEFFVVVILIIFGFFLWLRNAKPKRIENPQLVKNEPVTVLFERILDSYFYPNVRDTVKLWNKPDTVIVNMYAKGSSSGDGKIGVSYNEELSNHLSFGGQYKATIVKVEKNFIHVEIIAEDVFKTESDYREEQKEKWRREIIKPYKPKKSWELVFSMPPNFKTSQEILLGNKDIEHINLNNIESNIWLVHPNGHVITKANRSGSAATIRTLRAIFSGHKVILKYKGRDYGYGRIEATIEGLPE